jgi:glyoxylase-like metal-dependent hydrolase (beta-lactamase superfamily II)
MARWAYSQGLHDLGNGSWAYLQPDGSWGWSNAGLVSDGGEALLVDTLFDLRLTREMLERMRDATPAAQHIRTLVNTHANGDHYFGNQLVAGAEIVAARACLEEMRERPPEAMREMMRNWREQGEAGAYRWHVMGQYFDFDGIVFTPPTRVFDGSLALRVGGKEVSLVEVGPAHTRGDILVHVPADRTVFTGDILFIGGHPIVWAGPVGNWLKACDLILSWDVETIVPGHGPVTDKAGVRAVRQYFVWLRDEARKRFDAGMDFAEAARDISLDRYADWTDPERVIVNVHRLYREFAADDTPPDMLRLFALMGRYRSDWETGRLRPGLESHPD